MQIRNSPVTLLMKHLRHATERLARLYDIVISDTCSGRIDDKIAELAEERKCDEGFMRVGRLFISSRKFFMKMKGVLQCRTYGRDKNETYRRRGRFYSASGVTTQYSNTFDNACYHHLT